MPRVADPPSVIVHSMTTSPSLMDNIQHHKSLAPTSPTNLSDGPLSHQHSYNPVFHLHPSTTPPPGARAPMIRRPSRFDPMETTAEEDGHDELGSQHPLRRIREDLPPERSANDGNVSLPGIKALLNATDVPTLISPFAPSFSSPSVHDSTSPLDSPTSRTSRFSSFASAASDGWWAPPDERSTTASGGYPSRSGSFSRGPLDDEPDFKRRRSDLAPTLADADEIARLKWQAQSRNASFPVSGSMSGGSGLRTMLYPPLSCSSNMSRSSFSGTPMGSPLSPTAESPRDYSSSRASPMTGPLARSFAELTASERSPGDLPGSSRSRSPGPVERRPSLFLQRSHESIQALAVPPAPRDSVSGSDTGLGPTDAPPKRLSLTRPPSPEPSTSGPRRASLAELIKASSGDDIALAKGLFKQASPAPAPPGPSTTAYRPAPSRWLTSRRDSAESVHSVTSVPAAGPLGDDAERADPIVPIRDRRNASAVLVAEPHRYEDEEVDPKSDPGMRGMEVLAESARRMADAERKTSIEDREPSPTKPSATTPTTSPPTTANMTNNSNNNNNVSAVAGTGPKYSCQYCSKTFSRPSSLRIHTYSHTGERPFICKEPSCRRRFSVQSNLKRHAKVHQLQAQQQATAQINQRGQAPPRHPHHAGPGLHPQQQPPYGYPPHGGPPPSHPHMVHHGPPGYNHGPPIPGYGPPGRPGYDTSHGLPPHFAPPGGVRPGHPGDHMGPHYGMPRRHSHDVDAGRGVRAEEWSDEEVDELDDDE